MNEAQKFLIEQGYSDLVISQQNIVDPKKWMYVSDVMMAFQQRNLTTHSIRAAESCPKGGDHKWGVDGLHSNEFCKKCFDPRP